MTKSAEIQRALTLVGYIIKRPPWSPDNQTHYHNMMSQFTTPLSTSSMPWDPTSQIPSDDTVLAFHFNMKKRECGRAWSHRQSGESMIVPKQMLTLYISVERHSGMILTAESRKHLEKNLSQCHFVQHKSYTSDPGANPGRRGDSPTTNCLSHGTAYAMVCSTFRIKKKCL
jgi:hypothetical protein